MTEFGKRSAKPQQKEHEQREGDLEKSGPLFDQ